MILYRTIEVICLSFRKSRNLQIIAFYKFRIKNGNITMLIDKANPEVPEVVDVVCGFEVDEEGVSHWHSVPVLQFSVLQKHMDECN